LSYLEEYEGLGPEWHERKTLAQMAKEGTLRWQQSTRRSGTEIETELSAWEAREILLSRWAGLSEQ